MSISQESQPADPTRLISWSGLGDRQPRHALVDNADAQRDAS